MSSSTYYAVKKGHKTGIFKTWDECKAATSGFSGPIFRKFNSFEEASQFMNNKNNNTISSNNNNNNNIKASNKTITSNNNNSRIKSLNLNAVKTGSSSNANLEKIKDLVKNIKSSPFSDDLNYNVENWSNINNDIYIFTDGSSRKTNDYLNSGTGVYLGYQCTNIKEQYHDYTNNMCELLGLDYAFKLIVKYSHQLSEIGKVIKIVSDSEYCIKSCSVWLANWKKNNWKTKNGDDVKNKELIESIDASMTRIKFINSKLDEQHKIKVKLVHINSHQQMPDATDKIAFSLWFGNFVADYLANNS